MHHHWRVGGRAVRAAKQFVPRASMASEIRSSVSQIVCCLPWSVIRNTVAQRDTGHHQTIYPTDIAQKQKVQFCPLLQSAFVESVIMCSLEEIRDNSMDWWHWLSRDPIRFPDLPAWSYSPVSFLSVARWDVLQRCGTSTPSSVFPSLANSVKVRTGHVTSDKYQK